MVRRGARRLRCKTVRAMLTWSHYRFRQRLLQKAEATGGACRVLVVDEAYTSKTCGGCGRLQAVGGRDMYVCGACGMSAGRDANGARNVLLRWLARNDE